MAEIATRSPLQYLDKASAALREMGLMPEKVEPAPINALLEKISDLDKDKIALIARTLGQAEVFNEVVREQTAQMEIGQRYEEITNGFNSIRDDAKRLVDQVSDGKVDIFERGTKTYYVVDASQHFRLPPSTPTRLMVLRSSPVAVLVDSIDRMAEIERTLPLPMAFSGEERKWYRALALVNGRVVPVINVPPFLTAADQVISKSVVGKLVSGVTA